MLFTTVIEGKVPNAPVWVAVIVVTLLKGITSVVLFTLPHCVPVTVDFSTSPNAPVLFVLSLKAPVTYRLPVTVRVVPPGLAFCVNMESASVVDVKPVIGSVTSKIMVQLDLYHLRYQL